MAKLVKKLSLKQGDTSEEFYFDATTGVKGYEYFSTDAVIIGKWTDGRPVYRKVFTATSGATKNTSIIFAYNSKDQDIAAIDTIVKISGCVFRDDTGHIMQIPHASQATYDERISVYYRKGSSYGLYEVHTADYYNSRKIVVVVDFTKTTDQPDSFKEETIELTAEHKTGETFNGKPVYERVINVKAGTALNTWNTVGDIDATNIDKMLLFDANWYGGTGWVSLGKYTTNNLGTAVHISSATNKLYEIHSEAAYNSKDVVVVIKYTKTTD